MRRGLISCVPPWLLALWLVAFPHLLLVISQWHAIPLHDGQLVGPTDTDPWLRLVMVREWLTSGDWFNHAVVNSNAPIGGITSPWTRPLDLVIAGLVALQPDSVSLDMRLMHAALLLPWLWMLLLLGGVYRIVRRVSPLPFVYFMATVLVAAMPITWNYFGTGNADHHAPLAVLFIWALGGILQPAPSWRTLVMTGLLLALQLWISFEAVILIGLIYTWMGLQWLRTGDATHSRRLALLSSVVALASLAAVMIEYPISAWLAPVYDSLSIVYVVLLALAAWLALLIHFVRAARFGQRVVMAAVGSGVVLFTFLTLYPMAIHGPMAGVDAFILNEFLPRISEAKPLLKNTPFYVLGAVIQPLLALAICGAAWFAPSYSFYRKTDALAFGFFTLALFILYVSQQRWSYYLYPLIPCVLAPIMAALFEPEHSAVVNRWPASRLLGLSEQQQAGRRLPLILAVIGLPIALMLLAHSLEQGTGDRQTVERRESCYQAARQLIRSGELTRVLGDKPRTVLAPTDLGTEILFFTPHRIVASNYHREGPGIAYAWETNRITDAAALRKHLAERSIDVVLACPTVEHAQGSMIEAIVNGKKPPRWLKLLPYNLPTSTTYDIRTPEFDVAIPTLLEVKIN